MKDYEQEIVNDTVRKIQAAGFRVFLAEQGNYGFYTDKEGTRVVSFQTEYGGMAGISYSGNYKTSDPRSTGTGWRLKNAPYSDMFNQHAPQWAVGSAKWRYTTLAEHLKTYQASSKYKEVDPAREGRSHG